MTSSDGFKCDNCGKWVPINEFIGTKNRNHCPYCLWSKHVDDKAAGDRAATCQGKMQPIGLTIKRAGKDKYGNDKTGELMLVHVCATCGKVSINRLAGDDNDTKVQDLLNGKELTPDQRQKIADMQISILDQTNTQQVREQLFGKQ